MKPNIKKEPTKVVSIRFPLDLHAELSAQAKRNTRTLNQEVLHLLKASRRDRASKPEPNP